jgi:hypothetical protein
VIRISCATTMTISGDRSSVPPIGGTIRRTGRSTGNVSAFSTPASGPSGATHDRIACANTTMIVSHSNARSSAMTAATARNASPGPTSE